MSSKRHRVVLGLQAFQHMAHLLNDRAMECAENEGWPIPAVSGEPGRSIGRAGHVKRGAVLLGQHVQEGQHIWSGRKCSTGSRPTPRARSTAARFTLLLR